MMFAVNESYLSSDVVATRTLSNLVPVPGGVTTGGCQTACLNAGFPIAGTEWSQEVRVPFR
jgi:hypothetical protein